MPTFTVTSRFLAPVAEVWRIKTDPAIFCREFAPDRFELDPVAFAALFSGPLPVRVPARLRLGGLVPLAWPVTVEEATLHQHFVDSSANLLYRAFRHEHHFAPDGDGCRYTDRVTFEPRFALFGLVAALTRSTFARRHANAAKVLPVDPAMRARFDAP